MMTSKTRLTYISIYLILVIAVSGCFSLKKKYPAKNFYVLDANRSEEKAASVVGEVLRVRKVNVSPRYQGKSFVYRQDELRYESDFYNEFMVSPSAIFTRQVRDWLDDSGLFTQVTDTASYEEASYLLEGEVLELHGDYSEVKAPKAVLAMKMWLIDIHDPRESKMLFKKTYRDEVALPDTSSDALSEGWNSLLKSILRRLEDDIRQAVDQNRKDTI